MNNEKKMDRPFLIGNKIYLRPFDIEDLDGEYIQWINDQNVRRFLDTLKMPMHRKQVQNYIENILDDHTYVLFAIIEKSTNHHVGNVKIGPINWIDRTANFGRLLSRDCWGKGYGTESLHLIMEYAFETLNLNKLWDSALTSNIASIKSVKNAGMKIEGKLNNHSFNNGKYESITIYGITQNEYFEIKNRGRPKKITCADDQ